MVIRYVMPVIGAMAAYILRGKRVRSEAVLISGFLLAVLVNAIQGFTGVFTEIGFIILYTLSYSLGYAIIHEAMYLLAGKVTAQRKKRTFLTGGLLLIILLILTPFSKGTITYHRQEDQSEIQINYKNARTIWDCLRRRLGCTRAAAAGVLGSMFAESEYNPDIIESNEVGHGIGQWSWDRWYGEDGLEAYANAKGKDWSDMNLQLSFFRHEVVDNDSMNVYFPGGFSRYRKLRSVDGEDGTAQTFFYSFEYGDYVSYETFISDEFDEKYATRYKRLTVAKLIYHDKRRFP